MTQLFIHLPAYNIVQTPREKDFKIEARSRNLPNESDRKSIIQSSHTENIPDAFRPHEARNWKSFRIQYTLSGFFFFETRHKSCCLRKAPIQRYLRDIELHACHA